jgi:hypothetical protein
MATIPAAGFAEYLRCGHIESGRSPSGFFFAQANNAICSWLTKLWRWSSFGRPMKLMTDTRATFPCEGVSSTPGSTGSPSPPNNGSLTVGRNQRLRHATGDFRRFRDAAHICGEIAKIVEKCRKSSAAVSGELCQGLSQYLTLVGFSACSGQTRAGDQRRYRVVDGHREIICVVGDGGQVADRLKREWPAGCAPWCPNDNLGLIELATREVGVI